MKNKKVQSCFLVLSEQHRDLNPRPAVPCCPPVNPPPSLRSSGKCELTVCEAAGRTSRKWAKCSLLLEPQLLLGLFI